MHRRLGSDVVEGEDVIVLIDLLTGDLAAQDLREDVVRVVDSGHRFGFSGGHGTRRSSVKPNRHTPKKVQADRKSVVQGKSVTVRVNPGGGRSIKKKQTT